MGFIKFILVSFLVVAVVHGQSEYQDPDFDEDALGDYVGNDVGGPSYGDTIDYDPNDDGVYSRKKRQADYDGDFAPEGLRRRNAIRRPGGRGGGRGGGGGRFFGGIKRLWGRFRGRWGR